MMTKLREFSTVFLIILVVAFLGMMVFEWGMDFTGMRQGAPDVAEVNGEKMSYELFSDMYQQAYQNEKARREQDLSENEMRNLRNQVWEQFVQNTLFQEEMKRLNITVSDSEIVHQIRHYPLPEIKQNPSFQTDGEFDWNKYYQSFNNPNMPWFEIEQFYREQLPFLKLQNIITSSVRVSDLEVQQEFIESNINARVAYLEIPFSKFNEPQEEISEEESRKFYKEHIDEYEQQEKRKLSYVLFPVEPTKSDSERTFRTFNEIKNRLESGEDFNELALIYSEDPAAQQNEGRYDYFERGAMVKPFEDACFNGKVGELVGPVETRFGYHLIKIEDKRVQDGQEQVKASHILLKVAAGPSTREARETAAGFFSEDARTVGFEQAAQDNEYTIEQTAEITEDSDFIPGFGRNFSISRFAFTSELNEISDVIFTDRGYAVFKLDEIIPEGPKPFEEVHSLVENRIRMERAKMKAREYSNTITEEIQSASFAEISSNDPENIVKYDSTDNFTLKKSIRSIGYHPEFNATAFALEQGEISERVETNRGIYFLNLLKKEKFDSSAFQSQYNTIRLKLLNEKKNRVFNDWYEHLKEKADIVDNRNLYGI